MNLSPSITTIRSFIAYQFSVLRMKALRAALWDGLTGTSSTLMIFPKHDQRLSPSRKLLGLKNIRVDQIVGSLNRESDFDSQFRPLKKHTLQRWMNAYLLHEQDGWSPIIVHKVNGKYFVEDGHHRVSVARYIGMDFIEATVWEYSTQTKPANPRPQVNCAEKSSTKVYTTS